MEPTLSLDEAKAVVATKTFPKITEESIKAKIADTTWYNPPHGEGFQDAHLTICIITMKNGFKFIGKAAPVSAANFDEEVGRRYSYEDAFKQIWAHEGYLLRETLSNQS